MISKLFSYDPGVGVSATYWEIVGFQIDYIQQVLVVHVAGWVNADARTNGLSPLCVHAQEFSQKAADEAIKQNSAEAGYAILNKNNEALAELHKFKWEDYIFDFGPTIKTKDLWDRLMKMPFFRNQAFDTGKQ